MRSILCWAENRFEAGTALRVKSTTVKPELGDKGSAQSIKATAESGDSAFTAGRTAASQQEWMPICSFCDSDSLWQSSFSGDVIARGSEQSGPQSTTRAINPIRILLTCMTTSIYAPSPTVSTNAGMEASLTIGLCGQLIFLNAD